MALRADLQLPDPNRPRPDEWYIKMIVKRLKWPKCENRETVILIFRQFWPRLSNRADEFYDRAITFLEEGGR